MAPRSNRTTEQALASYVQETGQLPDAVMLGFFTYFTISEDEDAPVEHSVLERAFDDLGLNPSFLPAPNRPVDAFKKATRDAEAKGGTRGGEHLELADGRRMNLLVRDVANTKEKVVRHLVRELVDPAGVRLAYETVGEAVFYHAELVSTTGRRKPTGHLLRVSINYDELTEPEKPKMERVRERIIAGYEHDCRYIDGMKLRAMVRDYVLYLNAVQLKPGVYFVHKSRSEEMRKLIALCDLLKNGSSMVAHPMVDLPAMREEVLEKFEAEAETRVAALCDDIANAMSSQTRITTDTLERFRTRYRQLTAKATEYTSTLGLAQERTAIHLERAMTKLIALQDKLIEDESARALAGAK